MEYTINNKKYSVSKSELQKEYQKVVAYTDIEFLENIASIAHLACIISFYKDLPNVETLSDEGIVHQLIHLMDIPNEPLIDLQEIRCLFNKIMEL